MISLTKHNVLFMVWIEKAKQPQKGNKFCNMRTNYILQYIKRD